MMQQYTEAAIPRCDGIPKPGRVRDARWAMRLATKNIFLRCRQGMGDILGFSNHMPLLERLSDNYAAMGFRASWIHADFEKAIERYGKALEYSQEERKRRLLLHRFADCASRLAGFHEKEAKLWQERFLSTGHGKPALESDPAAIAFHINEPLRRRIVALFKAASFRKSAAQALGCIQPQASSDQYRLGYEDSRQSIETLVAMGYSNKENMGIDRDFFGQVITVGMVYSLNNELFKKNIAPLVL